MTELTQEQKAQVARIVTGLKTKQQPGGIQLYSESEDGDWKSTTYHGYWHPVGHHRHWRAIVEWLAEKLMNEPILDPVGTKRGQLMRAIADKDTTALMALVLELSEGKS